MPTGPKPPDLDATGQPVTTGRPPDLAPDFRAENEKDAAGNATVDPNTIGTLIRHWWDGGANPVAIGQMLPFPQALGGSGTNHPLALNPDQQYAPNFVVKMHHVKKQADALWAKGDKVGAAAKYVESIIPLIGPWMAQQGDLLQQGQYAAVAGNTAGLATGIAEGQAADTGVAQAYPLAEHPVATNTARQASVLQRQAEGQVADKVLAPGNVRYRGRAQEVAPELLRRGVQGGRDDIRQWAQELQDTAGQQIDAATPETVPLKPYVDAVNKKIDALQVAGSDLPLETARLAKLRELRDHLRTLAPPPLEPRGQVSAKVTVPYEAIRKLRDSAYAKADQAGAYARAGNPDLGPVADAARDYGSAIREATLDLHPDLKAPNADYHIASVVDDLLNPALGRPKNLTPNQTGVTGGAATQAAVMLTLPHKIGVPAAALRTFVSVFKEVQSTPAWQLADATKKYQIAQALRAGNVGRAQSLLLTLAKAPVAATAAGTSALATAGSRP